MVDGRFSGRCERMGSTCWSYFMRILPLRLTSPLAKARERSRSPLPESMQRQRAIRAHQGVTLEHVPEPRGVYARKLRFGEEGLPIGSVTDQPFCPCSSPSVRGTSMLLH